MIQSVIVDLVVAAAFAWLVWSFAPAGLRRVLRWRRRPAVVAIPDEGADTTTCGCAASNGGCKKVD